MRIGIVGAGAIAHRHVHSLRMRAGVEVAVVCDVEEARAARLASEINARVSTSWQTMLERDALDCVFICTPPATHAAVAVAALARGLAVYLEKPLARTLEDGRRIVEAWHASSSICAVGYQWRSLDLLSAMRDALGTVVPGMLVSRSYGPTEPGRRDRTVPGSWFVDPERSGGILFELASHDIDLQCALAGPVEWVQAASASGHLALTGGGANGLDDALALTLRFASGTLGSVVVAWTDAADPPVYSLDLLGAEVALHLRCEPAFQLSGRARGSTVLEQGRADPRESSIDRFLDAVIRDDRAKVPCSPADAFGTLATAIACEQAIATGARAAVAAG